MSAMKIYYFTEQIIKPYKIFETMIEQIKISSTFG